MQPNTPEKFFSDFLNEPSNSLQPFFAELEKNPDAVHRELKLKTPKLPKIEWASRVGNGDGKISFSDGTTVTGNFKNFKLQEGTIVFPSGLRFKGKFRSSDNVMVDIFQSGTITFNDGTYVRAEFENLKMKKMEVFEANNALLGRLTENEQLIIRPKLSNIIKRFDVLTFSEDSLVLTGELENLTYSFFGLYLKKENTSAVSTPFFARNNFLTNKSKLEFDLSTYEIDFLARNKNPEDSILRFEMQAFPGLFVFYADDIENPNCGSGYFLLSDFHVTLTLFSSPDGAVFILKNKVYSPLTIKAILKKMIDEQMYQKFNNSEFYDMEATQLPNSKDSQFQQTLNRMVRKYECIQKLADSSKTEFRSKLNHLININNALQKKNEELVTNEAESKNQKKKFETENKNLINEIQIIAKDSQNAKCAAKADSEKQKVVISDLQSNLRRITNDLEAVKMNSKIKIDTLLNEKNELEIKLKKFEEQMKSLIEQSDISQRHCANLQGTLQSETSKIEKINQFLKDSSVRETALREQVSRLLDELNFKNVNWELLDGQLKTTQNTLERTQESLTCVTQQLKSQIENTCVLFKGQMTNGKKEGVCIYQTSKLLLDGNFVNDLLQGQATSTDFETLKIIKGNLWKEGVFYGNELFVGTVKYKGPIVNNHMHGRGYFEFINGFNLEATFQNDEISSNKNTILIDLNDGEEVNVKLANDKTTLMANNGKKWTIDFKGGNILKL